MTRSYEDLVGGLGRAVMFRAERHRADEILQRRAARLLCENGEFPIFDLSMNGVSVLVGGEADSWRIDSELPVQVAIHEDVAYDGSARIVRSWKGAGSHLVALRLLSGFIDLHEVKQVSEERALTAALEVGSQPSYLQLDEAYRSILLEAVDCICFFRDVAARHERRYKQSGAAARRRIEELTQRLYDQFVRRWDDLRARASRALLPIFPDRNRRRAYKSVTERCLTPLLLSAPNMRRAYEKPFGYAGDYQTLLYLYRDGFEGPDVFSRVLHRMACNLPLSVGVRKRKDLLKNLTTREVDAACERTTSAGAAAPFRVTSLGCGPSVEVKEFLETRADWTVPVEWTLIDQEEMALSLAHGDVFKEVAQGDVRADVQCVYLSFGQLLGRPDLEFLDHAQDFIYASGLFDYLRARTAKQLVEHLFSRLRSGGLLAIGNASWPNEHIWMGEFVLDWSMVFRTEDDMRDLASGIEQVGNVEVVRDDSGAYYFLLVRKA